MIRIIRTQTLRALQEGAELASVLETDLEAAEARVAAFEADQADDVEQLQKLSGEVSDLRVELVAAESRGLDLHRLVELLIGATKYAFDAADAPVHVVQHGGRVRSAHRDGKSARAATPYPDDNWLTSRTPDPDPMGWKITVPTPPPLPAPDSASEIEFLLERLERPALEQLDEARELEAVRSQRDTAIENTQTAAEALTAESLAFAFHRMAVTEAVTEIAMALSARNPRAAMREVSALLMRHAELFGIDPHGPKDGADTETKGAVA